MKKEFEVLPGGAASMPDPVAESKSLLDANERLNQRALVKVDREYTHYRADNGSEDFTLCAKPISGPHRSDPLETTCPNCWAILGERRLVPRTPEMVRLNRTVLTRKLSKDLVKSVENGTPPETAAALYGVSKRQLVQWVTVGSQLLESDSEYFTADEMELIEFTQALRKAVAQHEVKLTQAIVSAGQIPKHWQANTWMLEKYHPDRYGQKTKIEIQNDQSNANGVPEVDFSKLSDAELMQLDDLMSRARGKLIDVTPQSHEHQPEPTPTD